MYVHRAITYILLIGYMSLKLTQFPSQAEFCRVELSTTSSGLRPFVDPDNDIRLLEPQQSPQLHMRNVPLVRPLVDGGGFDLQ